MPSQISDEVRELMVHWRYAQNYDHTTIAILAKCNISTVYRILTRLDETGSPHALPRGHCPPQLEQDDIFYILALLEANPTLYLDEIQFRLKTVRHVEVSLATICRTLYRQGWSRKAVSRAAMERDELLRSGWIYEYADIPKHCFMWLDEAGVSDRDHRREEGWAPVGVAPVRSEPFGRDLRLTMLPVLTEEGIIAMDILDGGVTKERFIQFLDEQVAPLLNPYDPDNPLPHSVVVLDNCAIHHDEEVKEIIERRGAKLVYLPPYSPDLNPIEQCFSAIKAWLQRHELLITNAQERMWAMHQSVFAVTAEDAKGWIRNCGYT